MDVDSRITLNIRGTRFEMNRATLKRIPGTRLSRLAESLDQSDDPVANEYFFARNPEIFSRILDYYSTGRLHFPTGDCGSLFEDELEYWGLDASQVAPCCSMTLTKHRETQEALAVLDRLDLDEEMLSAEETAKKFGFEDAFLSGDLNSWQKLKPKIWAAFDQPYHSSGIAKVIGWISIFFVLVSVGSFCVKTHGSMRVPLIRSIPVQMGNITRASISDSHRTVPHEAFLYVECLCLAWFSIESVMRFIFCPNKGLFLRSSENIIDCVTMLSILLDLVLQKLPSHLEVAHALELLSMIRILGLLKLRHHSTGLMILILTFKASAKELRLLVSYLVLCLVVFASFIYYAERIQANPDNNFGSIPQSFWWVMVTITTLGYGDVTPKTNLGMFMGTLTTLGGMLVLAQPVSLIVSKFAMYYSHTQARAKLAKKRRRLANVDLPQPGMNKRHDRRGEKESGAEMGPGGAKSNVTPNKVGVNNRRGRGLLDLGPMLGHRPGSVPIQPRSASAAQQDFPKTDTGLAMEEPPSKSCRTPIAKRSEAAHSAKPQQQPTVVDVDENVDVDVAGQNAPLLSAT